MTKHVYLDSAATTLVSKEVIEAMTKSLSEVYGNPSSTHHFGRIAKGQLEESRRHVANVIGAKPNQICFTSCGTESNNMVLRKSVEQLGVERILTTPIEHPSVYQTLKELAQKIEVVYLPICPKGSVLVDQLEQIITSSSKKALISVMHANNELGTLNDIESICNIAHKNGALVHSDMVQTVGHLPIDVTALGIDFIVASAHKFHGPKGIGFLYSKQTNAVGAFISGGSQERGMRSGTEGLASIVGLSVAIQNATSHIQEDLKHVDTLRHFMAEKLLEKIPNIDIITPLDKSLYTVLSVGFPSSMSHDMLPFQLDMKGVACSSGSACSSGANKGSHVLEAINYPKDRKVIRFSFSKYNTKDEIEYAVNQIEGLYMEMHQKMSQ